MTDYLGTAKSTIVDFNQCCKLLILLRYSGRCISLVITRGYADPLGEFVTGEK